MIITTKSYPRAALVGNPSDGYNGKTIAFTFSNFSAQVTLYQTPELEILPNERDGSIFLSMKGLVEDVSHFGYYGGIRLLKATIKKFWEYCCQTGIQIDDRCFTIRYESTIPHRLGLAGSSAIITACMRALMAFYVIEIPKPVLANLIMSVEVDELGIAAGLQDRVALVYQGVTYMDFDRELMKKQGYGRYESINPSLLPPLYIAYRADLSEGSEVIHGNLRQKYNSGDKEVLAAIEEWKELTDRVRDALEARKPDTIGSLLDRNFDLRRKVSMVSRDNIDMVELARSCGATAKFTGSGGAIIGTFEGDAMFRKLEEALGRAGIEVIRPCVIVQGDECG